MVLNKNVQKLSSGAVVKYRVAEDFCSALACLVQCCLNYATGGLYEMMLGVPSKDCKGECNREISNQEKKNRVHF